MTRETQYAKDLNARYFDVKSLGMKPMAGVIEAVPIPVFLDTTDLAAGLGRAKAIIDREVGPIAANLQAALKQALDLGALLHEADLKIIQAGAEKIGTAFKAGLEDALRDLQIAGPSSGDGKAGNSLLSDALNIMEKGATSGVKGAALATVGALGRSLTGESEALRLKRISDVVHMPMLEFQAWRGAALRSDVQEPQLISFFKNMGKKLEEGVAGSGKLAGVAKDLNIPLKDDQGGPRDVRQVVLELAEAFRSMDGETAQKTAGQLGIQDNMRAFLSRGREDIVALLEKQRGLGGYDERNAALSQQLAESINDAGQALDGMRARMERKMTPDATAAMDKTAEQFMMMGKNEDAADVASASWDGAKSMLKVGGNLAGYLSAVAALNGEGMRKSSYALTEALGELVVACGQATAGLLHLAGVPKVDLNAPPNYEDNDDGFIMEEMDRLGKLRPPARPFFRSHEEPDAGASPRFLVPSQSMNDVPKLMLDITAATRDTAAFLAEASAEPRTVNNETTVSIDTIDIVTQATDARGIAANIYDAVALQIVRGIPDAVDSGVRQA